MQKRVIVEAFASLDGYKGNADTATRESDVARYLRCACVSLISARIHNPECDVLLVHNLPVLSTEHASLLAQWDIKQIRIAFDSFRFPQGTKWSLAFFKLCAMKWVLSETQYEVICLLDTDTYIIGGLDALWDESECKIMLYNVQHSLNMDVYQARNAEYAQLFGKDERHTVYGGEIICGNRVQLHLLMSACDRVYARMKEQNFETKFGDEFIMGCAAPEIMSIIKDAAPYIRRYWTTNQYYQADTDYALHLLILHMPGEKAVAFNALYRYLYRHGELPANSRVFKLFGLPKTHRPFSAWRLRERLRRRITNLFKD